MHCCIYLLDLSYLYPNFPQTLNMMKLSYMILLLLHRLWICSKSTRLYRKNHCLQVVDNYTVTSPSAKNPKASRDWIPKLSCPRAEKLLTICLEELVSASFVNCAGQYSIWANFNPTLKCWVFIRPEDNLRLMHNAYVMNRVMRGRCHVLT